MKKREPRGRLVLTRYQDSITFSSSTYLCFDEQLALRVNVSNVLKRRDLKFQIASSAHGFMFDEEESVNYQNIVFEPNGGNEDGEE